MTAAGVIAGAQLAGGIVSGIAQRNAARDAAEAARAAGQRALEAAEANAILLEDIGRAAAAEQRKLFLLLGASQQVAFAKNGVNVGTGSALDIALDTAVEGEVSAQRAQFGFESAAYRERVKGIIDAFNADSSASIIASSGLAQGTQTILGGFTSALGTVGSIPPKSAAPAGSGTTVKVPVSAPRSRTLPLHNTTAELT